MALDQAEEEQIEQIKAWWKDYGPSVVTGIVLGVAVLGGYKYWNYQKEVEAEKASLLYAQVLTDFRANNTPQAMVNTEILINDYDSTPYSAMAALLFAKLDYETGKIEEAKNRLQWVLDNSVDDGLTHTARLRLGRIYLEQNSLDRALDLADTDNNLGFASEYQELRADVLVAKGSTAEAKLAYRKALQELDPNSGYRNIIEMKLANLGSE